MRNACSVEVDQTRRVVLVTVLAVSHLVMSYRIGRVVSYSKPQSHKTSKKGERDTLRSINSSKDEIEAKKAT